MNQSKFLILSATAVAALLAPGTCLGGTALGTVIGGMLGNAGYDLSQSGLGKVYQSLRDLLQSGSQHGNHDLLRALRYAECLSLAQVADATLRDDFHARPNLSEKLRAGLIEWKWFQGSNIDGARLLLDLRNLWLSQAANVHELTAKELEQRAVAQQSDVPELLRAAAEVSSTVTPESLASQVTHLVHENISRNLTEHTLPTAFLRRLREDWFRLFTVAFRERLKLDGAARHAFQTDILSRLDLLPEQVHELSAKLDAAQSEFLLHFFGVQDDLRLLAEVVQQGINESKISNERLQATTDQVRNGVDLANESLNGIRDENAELKKVLVQQLARLGADADIAPRLVYDKKRWPHPVPFHNRRASPTTSFVGRDGLLADIANELASGKEVALVQPLALRGEGGVGKTRAAVEFARKHCRDYELLLFLDCQSPETLRAALADVAIKLDLIGDPTAKADEMILLTLRLLRAVDSALIVFDNVDNPEAVAAMRVLIREPGGVRFLVTSRLRIWGRDFAPHNVNELKEADAVKLLQIEGTRNGHQPGPDSNAAAVASELGRLPLGLLQAAGFVSEFQITWREYLQELLKNPAVVLSQRIDDLKDSGDSILRTYALSFAQLDEAGRDLLRVAAHLAPSPIPIDLILPRLSLESRSLLVHLNGLHLVEWLGDTIDIHRAVALAIQAECRHEERTAAALTKACQRLIATVPDKMNLPDSWPRWAKLRPHVETVLRAADSENLSSSDYGSLRLKWADFLEERHEYVNLESLSRSYISWFSQRYGVEHPQTLESWQNLAWALGCQGRDAEAEQEYRALLATRERVLGSHHPDTLLTRRCLALAFDMQGKQREAELEYRTIADGCSQALGTEHLDTLRSRLCAAIWLKERGRTSEAEQEIRAVLAIQERVFGSNHHESRLGRYALASCLTASAKHSEAENELRALMAVQEQELGPEHPHILMTRADLARCLHVQGRIKEAHAERLICFSAQEALLGPEHSDTLRSREDLVAMLSAQGRHVEAEQEYRAILLVRERAHGQKHLGALRARNGLASTLSAQGKHGEAEREYRTTLAVRDQVQGTEHAETLLARNFLAVALSAQGKHSEAEKEYRAVLAVREKRQGPEHTDTLASRNSLAVALFAQGKHSEAEKEYMAVLAVQEKSLGPEHTDTLASRYNLALALSAQGKHSEAEKEYIAVLAVREKRLGPEHTDTLTSRYLLGLVLAAQSKHAKAEREFRTVLAVWERLLGPEHAYTIVCRFNLAVVLLNQGKCAPAEIMFRGLLEVRERLLGVEHLDTNNVVACLAGTLYNSGQWAEAERLFLRALNIYERLLGVDDATTFQVLAELSATLWLKGDWVEAERLLRIALSNCEMVFGIEHGVTLTIQSNLAFLLTEKGDREQAEPLTRRTLKVRELVSGLEHPLTLVSSHNLAKLLIDKGEIAEAEELLRSVLMTRERLLGAEHRGTLDSLNEFARLLTEKGAWIEAESLYRRVLEARERVSGLEHPETLESCFNLATNLKIQGKHEEAKPFAQRAYEVGGRVLWERNPYYLRFRALSEQLQA